MPLTFEPRNWHRHMGPDTFLCSTNREYLQLEAINAAYASDMMWWAQAVPLDELKKIVDNSLCFGLYHLRPDGAKKEKAESTAISTTQGLPAPATEPNGVAATTDGGEQQQQRVMIGFARIITDHVTFGYLTDVYVLPHLQGKGLGKWTMQCLNEVLDSLPRLRRFLLLTQNPNAARIYENALGARRGPSNGMLLLEKAGRGRKVPPAMS